MGDRLGVNINDRTVADLRRIRDRDGITTTEVVRRAVEVLAFLTDERNDGRVIEIYDPKTKTRNEVILL